MSTLKTKSAAAEPDPVRRLLTAETLAKGWEVEPPVIQRLRYRHGLPYVPLVGGEVRFDPVAVNEWLERRAKTSAKPGAQS